jgi:hypothetical protein
MSAPIPDVRIAAAQRVIKGCDWVPRVREVAGAVEVVSVKDGRLRRHIIDESGLVTLVETRERPARWWVGRAVLLGGLLLTLLGMVFGLSLIGLDGEGARVLVAMLGGVAAWWGGWWVSWTATSKSLNEFREDDGWSELKALGLAPGKPPLDWLSMAQLCAVEGLATRRGDEAVVRQQADGGAEVVTEGQDLQERHLVGRDGSVFLMDSTRSTGRGWTALKDRAQDRYGGTRSDWSEFDLRPSD